MEYHALRFASFASNIQIVADMYEKINQAIFEADEKSKALSREQTDNVYLASFTANPTIRKQQQMLKLISSRMTLEAGPFISH